MFPYGNTAQVRTCDHSPIMYWVELRQHGHVYIVLVQMYWKMLVISVISILNRILVLFVCPKNMSGITKEELIEILNKMLDEKFEEKFKLQESKLDKKLAPIKKSVYEALQSVQFISSKYDEIKDNLKLILRNTNLGF